MKDNYRWLQADTDVFWGEIAPCDHVVQIYENDEIFLDLLSGFVSGGFNTGDSVIVIATKAHLNFLEQRLKSKGYDLFSLSLRDQYIPLCAEETLASFMLNDWPDENLFIHAVSNLLAKAKKRGRNVRAFGEMVAILWAQGHNGATVQLEHLWNKFCEKQAFSLFCAYPKSGFTEDANSSAVNICCSHSKMVADAGKGLQRIMYKDIAKVM